MNFCVPTTLGARVRERERVSGAFRAELSSFIMYTYGRHGSKKERERKN